MSNQQSWFEKNPKKTLGITLCFGICAIILCTEVGCHLFFLRWTPGNADRNFWAYDRLLGWRHKPGQKGRFVHRDFSVDVQINSDGLRDHDYSIERTTKKRMLVLGDSFGWGFGVEHSEIFSELLEQSNPHWEIINASVSGYGTDQQLLYLTTQGIRYRPDVILLLFCENDFITNTLTEATWYYKPVFRIEHDRFILKNVPVPESTLKQQLDRVFYGKTYFLVRVYRETNLLLENLHRVFFQHSQDFEVENRTWRDGASVTTRLITEMNDLSRSNHSQLLIVSVPMKVEQVKVLQKLSLRENIPYLPLNQSFDQSYKETTFAHDGHWNVKGHKITAEAIEKFLKTLGIF